MADRSGVAACFTILLCVASHAVHAQQENFNLRYNGYGTLGVVYSDEDQADYVSNVLAPDGAGFTRDWSPEVDSRFGLQAAADISDRLTGVVQVVSEQQYDDGYDPAVEWANLELKAAPGLSIRAGRMVLPVFMTSEYRKVGFANPWVRPPEEVYRLVPVTNFDGVAVSYRNRFNGFTNTVRVTYGRKDAKLPGGGEVESRNGMTLVDTLEWGATSLFASYSRSELTIDSLNPLFDAFREFGPRGEDIAARYDVDDKTLEFVTLGARYDPGNWLVMGEWVKSKSRTFIGDSHAWYVTGGYRFGAFTPYLTLAAVDVDSNTSDPGLPTAGLPPPVAGQARELNAVLNQLLGSAAAQESISLGVRWDVATNMALKVQYDHLDLDTGSPGVLSNVQPGFQPGGSVNVLSLALDFVF